MKLMGRRVGWRVSETTSLTCIWAYIHSADEMCIGSMNMLRSFKPLHSDFEVIPSDFIKYDFKRVSRASDPKEDVLEKDSKDTIKKKIEKNRIRELLHKALEEVEQYME